MPMLPVTHGDEYTRLQVLLYTLILIGVTLMPFATKMSGLIYLSGALALDAVFLYYAIKIYRDYSDQLARKAFRYSIIYLAALFAVLLVDHYFYF
jgi:protoheme IX farnesyltransferase